MRGPTLCSCPTPSSRRPDLRPGRRGLRGSPSRCSRSITPAGERAYIRKQPHGRLFVTRDPADTILFPDRPPPLRPAAVPLGAAGRTGSEFGYLIEGRMIDETVEA